MKPYFGILSQSNGNSILKPTQDMVIGTYYLTLMINKSNFLSQICFFNEEEALKCYYKKKITIHSPILVRYLLSEFTIKVFSGNLKILDQSYLSLQNEHIKIYKELESKNNKLKTYYFITNIGVLVGRKKIKSYYKISDLFLETTPGRIIFNSNIINLLANPLKE
jgi:DNA-directed RNA polymerase beta' subunit